MPLRVGAVRVRRFKNVTDATIELSDITILVGANSSGKSSVLQAIQFATSIAQSAEIAGLQVRGDQVVGSLAAGQLVYSPLRDIGALASGGRLLEDIGSAIRVSLDAKLDGHVVATEVVVRRGRNRNINVELNGRTLGNRLQNIQQPFSVYVPGLAGISSFEAAQTPGVIRKAAARGDANSVLRNILLLLHADADAWRQFSEDLERVYPDSNLNVSFDPDVDDYITITANRGLPIDASGTGLLQTIQILAYINVYRPSLLLLDEPDSHLHPNNQRRLARLLVKLASEREIQIVLATHSRHMLDELVDDARVYWLREGAVQPDAEFDLVTTLLDLGALDKGDQLRHGATRWVVITEDTDTAPLSAILEASGFQAGEFDIWSYHGSSNVSVATTLAAFIRSIAPATNIIVHRDRDYLDDEAVELYQAKLTRAGIVPFVTRNSDLEAYFIDPAHLRELYPGITPDRAIQLIEEATEAARDISISKQVDYRDNEERRKRNNGIEGTLSAGQIALDATQRYNANPERYRHGKSVLKRLRERLQREPGGGTAIIRASDAVVEPTLSAILQPVAPEAGEPIEPLPGVAT